MCVPIQPIEALRPCPRCSSAPAVTDAASAGHPGIGVGELGVGPDRRRRRSGGPRARPRSWSGRRCVSRRTPRCRWLPGPCDGRDDGVVVRRRRGRGSGTTPRGRCRRGTPGWAPTGRRRRSGCRSPPSPGGRPRAREDERRVLVQSLRSCAAWASRSSSARPSVSNVSPTQNDGRSARTRMTSWSPSAPRRAVSRRSENPRNPPTRVGAGRACPGLASGATLAVAGQARRGPASGAPARRRRGRRCGPTRAGRAGATSTAVAGHGHRPQRGEHRRGDASAPAAADRPHMATSPPARRPTTRST